ncbi:hypothetical protein [Psittacicella hinzii]|uniref:Uncharacterized protein n=1 Tax=Psittacicella hinzii TaxID=2028575 RepID=A0A3A1YQH6_9GAMM|nr:hypothetical protein [Psittacicella hinzii]RIY38604.1 hypothetical protein CKF58_03820 [Psittacicella hinzii]
MKNSYFTHLVKGCLFCLCMLGLNAHLSQAYASSPQTQQTTVISKGEQAVMDFYHNNQFLVARFDYFLNSSIYNFGQYANKSIIYRLAIYIFPVQFLFVFPDESSVVNGKYHNPTLDKFVKFATLCRNLYKNYRNKASEEALNICNLYNFLVTFYNGDLSTFQNLVVYGEHVKLEREIQPTDPKYLEKANLIFLLGKFEISLRYNSLYEAQKLVNFKVKSHNQIDSNKNYQQVQKALKPLGIKVIKLSF